MNTNKLLNEKMAEIRERVIERKLQKLERIIKPVFISWIVSIIALILMLHFTSVTNQYVSYLISILMIYVGAIPSGLILYMIFKGVKRLEWYNNLIV